MHHQKRKKAVLEGKLLNKRFSNYTIFSTEFLIIVKDSSLKHISLGFRLVFLLACQTFNLENIKLEKNLSMSVKNKHQGIK